MHRRTFLALPPATFATPAPGQAPVAVVASFSILGDMVAQVAGTHAVIRVIAGPDLDAHEFQPRPSDAIAIRAATLLVENGLGFDTWFDRLARTAADGNAAATPSRTRRVVASAGIDPLPSPPDAHGHAHRGTAGPPAPDPHAWQDVRRALRYVANIAAGLEAAAPDRAALWRERAAAYVRRLEVLDAWVRAEIASVPEARRVAITAHDAFGYFAAAYGVRFVAPQGLSAASEPSAAAVGRLIRRIRAEAISAVFVESVASPIVLDRIAREAGIRVRGRLYADALSPQDGPAATYEAMVRHNVGLLVPAMRGAA